MGKPTNNVIPFPRSKSEPPEKKSVPSILQDILDSSTPVQNKKTEQPLASFHQTGDNNIQAHSLVINNYNHAAPIKQVRQSTTIPPRTTEHISDTDAKRVHDLVSYLANIDKSKDGKPSFPKWWKRLKDRFNVSSYYFIPAHRMDEVIKWGESQKFVLRDKLKKTDYQEWRKLYYAAIYAKAKTVGLDSRDKLYAIIMLILEREVDSMKNLSDSDLKLVHKAIMSDT